MKFYAEMDNKLKNKKDEKTSDNKDNKKKTLSEQGSPKNARILME